MLVINRRVLLLYDLSKRGCNEMYIYTFRYILFGIHITFWFTDRKALIASARNLAAEQLVLEPYLPLSFQ